MAKLFISAIIAFTSTIAFAGNCSYHKELKVSKAEAEEIQLLQAKADEAKRNGNVALFEALTAQARNVMEKRAMN